VSAGPGPRVAWRQVDGIVLLDKPAGLTSNAALQRVRRLYAARKAGHTGSLDPLATGMLPLCFGEATKFAGHLLDADKTYRVRLRFGVQTDTGDADGAVTGRGERESVPPAELAAVLGRFIGDILQVPPMFSALKQGGRRLHELARRGETVERPARPVRIHELAVVAADPETPELLVRCSKGTYIRSLVEDLAAALGTLAHVVALRRIAVVPFDAAAMVTLDELGDAAARGDLARYLLPIDAGLAGWPRISLSSVEAGRLRTGQAVTAADAGEGPGRLYGPAGEFLGVGDITADGRLVPRRLCAA
jgi:tRNA pseudouridine55 synthase